MGNTSAAGELVLLTLFNRQVQITQQVATNATSTTEVENGKAKVANVDTSRIYLWKNGINRWVYFPHPTIFITTTKNTGTKIPSNVAAIMPPITPCRRNVGCLNPRANDQKGNTPKVKANGHENRA